MIDVLVVRSVAQVPQRRDPVRLLAACGFVGSAHLNESLLEQGIEHLVPEFGAVGSPNWGHEID